MCGSSSDAPTLLWFRKDLRLQDNAALAAIVNGSRPLIACYLHDPGEAEAVAPGEASRVWLHQALCRLREDLRSHQITLLVRTGSPETVLPALAAETGASAVYWNHVYVPSGMASDAAIRQRLKTHGHAVRCFNSRLLMEPGTVLTQTGKPYQVFTPFWKALSAQTVASPVAVSMHQCVPHKVSLPEGEIPSLNLLPEHGWAAAMMSHWDVGEQAAEAQLSRFLAESLANYDQARNFPAQTGTSRLSPYLAWGHIGPRQIWQAVRHSKAARSPGALAFLQELAWRDFAYHVLHHFPQTLSEPLRPKYAAFPWRQDHAGLRAWQRGETGYPIVDAGMRELWQTGWMHNRVRMIVGSFLVKHLLLHWRSGAAWFGQTLVDADLANNTLGWQWVGGCGADAAPFFRIFNPITQGETYDPNGDYVRRFVPELSKLPNACLHRPWTASPQALRQAGVTLGRTYPKPRVDHARARARALAALASLKTV